MKPRVIIFYNRLFHYRIPIWNILSEKCDLTVTYSDGKGDIPEGMKALFNVEYLPARRIFKRFVIHKANIRRIAKQFDVVVAYGDISWLKFSTLPWFNKTKVVFHTLGVSASYDKAFDSRHEWDLVRKFFYSKANALAFYTSYPIEKYVKMGIPREKMFEAPNTVVVDPVTDALESEKDSLLFIGTLYKQKGLQNLLDAYLSLRDLNHLPKLVIIGNGPDKKEIQKWIEDNEMGRQIEMVGAIYDVHEKARFFGKALACISPNQAGLSVLESMGNGVPFVTTRSAITGGEIFNIHHEVDGVIMESGEQLQDIIKDITANRQKYLEMGHRAQQFYNKCRTPQHMADGLWNAIEYAMIH